MPRLGKLPGSITGVGVSLLPIKAIVHVHMGFLTCLQNNLGAPIWFWSNAKGGRFILFIKKTSSDIHHDNLYLHAIWQLFTSDCWLILPAALICMQHINIPQNRWPLIGKISNHSNFIKLNLTIGVNNGIYHITQLSSSCILLFCVKKCILLSIALNRYRLQYEKYPFSCL
jgi:hypothetical protein